ncbi:Oidioi.mRNA.OKI2018_I69.chr2.g4767.t1.cds [Oikopleura dioica]|uniref:Oidioi.mRNA.OKI2018_I69.chr2.g4767.t1.cds n=1 Tax=Oikopleura dioica TaxID=34765 RepID=A0ABN7SYG0_OIKDI|nr:Oidioi.mRNA.OKI2018_I69.chr2.g4767.t1.cds [Oikopleura dioica]
MGKKKNGNAQNKVAKHRNMKKTKTQKKNKDKEEEIRKMLNDQIDLIVTTTNGTLKSAPKKVEKIGLPAEVATDEIESLMTNM